MFLPIGDQMLIGIWVYIAILIAISIYDLVVFKKFSLTSKIVTTSQFKTPVINYKTVRNLKLFCKSMIVIMGIVLGDRVYFPNWSLFLFLL